MVGGPFFQGGGADACMGEFFAWCLLIPSHLGVELLDGCCKDFWFAMGQLVSSFKGTGLFLSLSSHHVGDTPLAQSLQGPTVGCKWPGSILGFGLSVPTF